MSEDTLTQAQDAARRFGKGTGTQQELQSALEAHTKATAKPAAKRSSAKAAPAKDEGESS